MLHWLAGQRPSDEPPETPAPLFAVRAFKHAVFGTPATVQPKSTRRNSNQMSRPTRPALTRPKSASDATLTADYFQDVPSSPTKGILLTPGTVGGRGKTVTFGDYLAEAAEKQRETDEELDLNAEPKCALGRHWKQEYERLNESAARDIRKLTSKQRATKEYAREKDTQCSTLADELKTERDKVEKLQARVNELEMSVKQLSQDLKDKEKSSSLKIQSEGGDVAHTTAQRRVSGQSLKRKVAIDSENAPRQRTAEEAYQPISTRIAVPVSLEPGNHLAVHPPQSTTTAVPVVAEVGEGLSARSSRRTRLASPSTPVAVSSTRVKDQALTDISVNAHHHSTQDAAPATPATSQVALFESVGKQQQPAEITETKENSVPSADAERKILSRRGEEIPPDRIAAARARLAARKQQRAES